ncbi:hypothetical protein [Couchioplanes caeruleus]|uniref:Uncharacterized protein n=2 Tax=Couchioplanes caeruleus TaxID=56438 RepID=A0A1K0GTC3_9ACTN|nr:hypothetical protein [Couchioplanes caeruleus]OJF14500.1 hypothetical protein BG844_09165 [Couchioplanes caeruleus subsp. caeruleus]ROP21238.1 hypothetical protein EDD30_7633 [Couchioplanes caeruleus]
MASGDILLADPSEPTRSRITGGQSLLACPGADPVAVRPEQVCRVERERAVDGSAVLSRETATNGAGDHSFDPDLITVVTLVDVLLTSLGVERGAPGSANTAVNLVGAVYAHALAVPQARLSPAPVAATPPSPQDAGPLTMVLRAATGVSRQGPVTWAEAEQLCAQVVSRALSSLGMERLALTWMLGAAAPDSGDDEPDREDGGEYDNAADEFWAETDEDRINSATFEAEPDPPNSDPWIAALLAAAAGMGIRATARVRPLPSTALTLLRPLSKRNWKRLLKWGLPAGARVELYRWVQQRRASGEIRPHSQLDGFIAEKALLALYLLDRKKVAAEVLAGSRVGGQTLGDVAEAGSDWETVRTALFSVVTNAVGQPDILDPALRHVYEIKPKVQAVRGAKQLYGRYLLFLNAWEIHKSVKGIPARRALVWSAEVLKKFAGYVTRKVPRRVDLSTIGPVWFWEPGSWTPPRRVLLWDGRLMDVEVPIPGVLCYQILGKNKDGGGPKAVDVRDIGLALLGLVLAQALADAAGQTGGPPAVEALTRAAGDDASGLDLASWLGGAAVVGAAAATAARMWQSLSLVAVWLGTLAKGVAGTAARLAVPVWVVVDPATGAPPGMSDRYGGDLRL